MEIALLPKNAVKIKGKQATVIINPTDASVAHQAAIFTGPESASLDGVVSVSGPGEYEIGGIKISGIKTTAGTVYSVNVDEVDILVGELPVLEKAQHKVKEHQLVISSVKENSDASFVTSLATNVILLYGELAREVMQKFAKENMTEVNKLQITKDKLPQDLQTILLQ